MNHQRTQSSEETNLIREIVADPDNNTPRQLYADWLDKHDRPERAEFIRLQCNLQEQHAREQQLLDQHGWQWMLEAYGAGVQAKFHRGFPEEVTLRLDDFVQNHAQLNNYTPLSHLHLHGPITGNRDADLTTFAQLPALHQVRSLEFEKPGVIVGAGDYGPEGLRALAASPYLKQLQKLSLHSLQIGAEGATVIAGSPTFQNLTHLTLSDPQFAEPKFDYVSLMRSPHLSRLQEITLGERLVNGFRLREYRGPTYAQDTPQGRTP